MVFAHDTTMALALAADLVNDDGLTEPVALNAFLDAHDVVPHRPAVPADVRAVGELRSRLRAMWETTDVRRLAGMINDMLRDSNARPWLTDHHPAYGWHVHVTAFDASLEHRIAAQAAFALADLVRLGELARLRLCAAPDCDAVLIDLSKNRSRIYCDTGNCGNRQHVAAYRARKSGIPPLASR